MEKDFKKRIDAFLKEYKKEEKYIANANKAVDVLIKQERAKEKEMGGDKITSSINSAIKFVKKEFASIDLDKIVATCNISTSITPIFIEDIKEDGDIFDNVDSSKGIINKFYSFLYSVVNMVNHLKDNLTLSKAQSAMLSKRLGEIVYFVKNINTKVDAIYEKEIVSVRNVIEDNVKEIEKDKEANDLYLENKKGVFKGEVEEVLNEFSFYYSTPTLSSKNPTDQFNAEYQFDVFLINEDAKYQDMIEEVAYVDKDLASKFKCRSLVTYDSTKAKTYIVSGTSEENMHFVFHNAIVSFLYSYPFLNKHIVFIDNQKTSISQGFMEKLDESSSHHYLYKDYSPVIKDGEVKDVLKDLVSRVNEIDQTLKQEDIDDVFIYNSIHPEKPIDIILLLINDYPFGMGDNETVELLSKVLELSNRCGIISIINYNKEYLVSGMKNISAKDLKAYNLKNILPLEKGDFDEEEFFNNISLLMQYYN